MIPGSEAWKRLPDEQRHEGLTSLLAAVNLRTLHSIRGMLRTYLRRIAIHLRADASLVLHTDTIGNVLVDTPDAPPRHAVAGWARRRS